jgi:lipoprotein-anchoring transpeptidase ErfK/SrfK
VVRLFTTLTVAIMLLGPGADNEARRGGSAPATRPAPKASESSAPSNEKTTTDGQVKKKPASWALGARSTTKRLAVFSSPNAPTPKIRLRARNPIRQKLVLLTRGTRERGQVPWLKVLLPDRPNGSSGWVRRQDVELVQLRQRITVDLSDRELTYYRKGELAHRFDVGIGAAVWPTPTGLFYVWARVPQANPNGVYGEYALGLSAFSVLSDWPGGGRVAIHGTTDPADRGAAVSHGCVRVYNPDMRLLKKIPMGTPVRITN